MRLMREKVVVFCHQWLTVKDIAAIEAATTIAEVSTALANAKAVIDEIKTDAQLTEEEAAAAAAAALAQAKTDAMAELDSYKNADDYRDAQKTELANAITAGKEAIDAAADADAGRAEHAHL